MSLLFLAAYRLLFAIAEIIHWKLEDLEARQKLGKQINQGNDNEILLVHIGECIQEERVNCDEYLRDMENLLIDVPHLKIVHMELVFSMIPLLLSIEVLPRRSTFMLIEDGFTHSLNMSGSPSVSDIIKWIRMTTVVQPIAVDKDQIIAAFENHAVVAIGLFEDGHDKQIDAFHEGLHNVEDVSFFEVVGRERCLQVVEILKSIGKSPDIKYKEQLPVILLYFDQDEKTDVFDTSHEWNAVDIAFFAELRRYPFISDLSVISRGKYPPYGAYRHTPGIVIVATDEDEGFIMEAVEKSIDELHGKISFSFTRRTDLLSADVLTRIGGEEEGDEDDCLKNRRTNSKHEFNPVIRFYYHPHAGFNGEDGIPIKRYKPENTNISCSTKEYFIKFVNDIYASKLPIFYRSESYPTRYFEIREERMRHRPVLAVGPLVITRNSWDSIVNKRGVKDVLVVIFATWCIHCRVMTPEYTNLANNLILNKNLIIGKFNVVHNEVPHDVVHLVTGYPTVLLFKGFKDGNDGNSEMIIEYTGLRLLDKFMEFIKENGTIEQLIYSKAEMKIKEDGTEHYEIEEFQNEL